MRRLIPLIALVLALGSLSGCDEDQQTLRARPGGVSADGEERADQRRAPGRDLQAYAPATDFTGAAPEDAWRATSALFDGTPARDAVAAAGYVSGAAPAGRSGKRLLYTAERTHSDLRGVVPPLPNDYDYSRSAAPPGSAREAGQTMLGFAAFQLEQKFPSVAPIMSRLGWRAAPRRGSNEAHTPYRVTVHHTQGTLPMNEAEAATAVKNIQHYHMVGRGREGKENFSDIGYHFLIAGDGRVLEGRRAEYLGAHASGANTGNIGVAMMGDFNKVKPTAAQIESLTRLVTYLSVKYKKDPNSRGFLEPHQHYTNTDCPGKNMMAILDALRRRIDKENEVVVAGGAIGMSVEFTPLAVLDAPSA